MRRHPLANCEECSLNTSQSVFVPSSLPASGEVKLVVVGEAPGVQEAKTGVPFIGPSGKLLEAVLAGQGLHRDQLFITNACLCRPKNNDTPTAKDVKACAPRLLAEVTEATSTGAPIIAMGNVAASAIFDFKVSILAHRIGPPKESHKYPGVPVIPTVHPAYVLRVADALPMLMDDLAKWKPQVQVQLGGAQVLHLRRPYHCHPGAQRAAPARRQRGSRHRGRRREGRGVHPPRPATAPLRRARLRARAERS